MNIHEDRETYSNAKLFGAGLAHIRPLKVTFRGDAVANERIIERVAREFVVYQYRRAEDGGPTYSEPWELFFWCWGDADGRDLRYFYLMSNDKAKPEEREEVYKRLRALLDSMPGECEVCFEYHTEEDTPAIEAEALRVFRRCSGKPVLYRGERGKLKWSERFGYYFMKDRARTKGYILPPRSVCLSISEVA